MKKIILLLVLVISCIGLVSALPSQVCYPLSTGTVCINSSISSLTNPYNATLINYATNGNTAYGWGNWQPNASLQQAQINNKQNFISSNIAGINTNLSKIGTLTNTKWCTTDGVQVICTSNAPNSTGGASYNATLVAYATNGNTAYGWGNHALAGYGHWDYNATLVSNANNGNTAFNWGDWSTNASQQKAILTSHNLSIEARQLFISTNIAEINANLSKEPYNATLVNNINIALGYYTNASNGNTAFGWGDWHSNASEQKAILTSHNLSIEGKQNFISSNIAEINTNLSRIGTIINGKWCKGIGTTNVSCISNPPNATAIGYFNNVANFTQGFTNGKYCVADSSDNRMNCTYTPTGGGTPAGVNGDIQMNNAGSFGYGGLQYNATNNNLTFKKGMTLKPDSANAGTIGQPFWSVRDVTGVTKIIGANQYSGYYATLMEDRFYGDGVWWSSTTGTAGYNLGNSGQTTWVYFHPTNGIQTMFYNGGFKYPFEVTINGKMRTGGIDDFSSVSALQLDSGDNTAVEQRFTSGTTTGRTTGDGFIIGLDSSQDAVINQLENKDIIISTNNVEKMRILDTGKIGMGTSAPQNILDVEGSVAIGSTYSGTNTAPTDGLIVEGDTGIGLNNPSYELDVYGTINVDGVATRTFRWANTQASPNTNPTPTFTSYYGGNTNALGDPVGWVLITVGNTDYRVPYYN